MNEQNNIPKHWQVKKLGEVCTYSKGKMPQVLMEEKNKECFIPYVNIKAFEKGIFAEYTNGLKCNLCEDDDLLMVWDGARCGLIGKAKKGAVGSTLMKILPKENIHKEYLYHFISSKFWTLNTKPKGVGIPHIEPTLLWNFELVVPPLPEQQAIVAKIEELLSDLENGKQQLLQAQQQLKVYRQSLLKAAFEGKLTPSELGQKGLKDDMITEKDEKDDKKEILKSSNQKNPNSDNLPEGWKWVKLGDIAIKKSIKALPKDYPDVKFIGMDCIEPHTLKPIFTYKFCEFKSAGNYFEIGQVLYGRMRPYLNKVYKAEYNGTCSGEFIILQCMDNFNPDLLKYILHSREFVSFANHKTSGDRPRITYEEISNYPIALPPISVQELIVSELESKLTVCDKIEETINQSLQQAETLRQSILKKAFEGKLV